jgi:hypothetical protein
VTAPESEDEREQLRRRALKALRGYFARRRWPRLMMSAIVVLTAGSGFLASFGMLRSGLDQMWLRYPTAALIAWAVFLVLLRLWAEFERKWFEPGEDIDEWLKGHDPVETRERLKERDWSVLEWLDVPSGLVDDAEGCLVGVVLLFLIALLIVALGAVINVVVIAPVLMAEVFLDAVLVAALVKRMRRLDQRWWLAGAVRHTAKPVLLTALALMVLGFVFQAAAPHARSIGDLFHEAPEAERP